MGLCINARGVKKTDITLTCDGNTISNASEVACKFGSYFSEMVSTQLQTHFQSRSYACTVTGGVNPLSMFMQPIDEHDVVSVVNRSDAVLIFWPLILLL